jgi:cyclic pyranopterin phosphate synthase
MKKQIDKYGRKIDYLRISVTDRCNLRCTYCMPSEGISLINHQEILRYEEIIRLTKLAYELGFRKFRITGGEPLVRKGVPSLIESISEFGDDIDLSLTTNAVLLAKYADELKNAGLKRINISLDTLDKTKFKQISRFDLFNDVIDGIRRSIDIGFNPIKINVVVVQNVNDDEILDFVEFAKDKPIQVRFIELMPFYKSEWGVENFVSAEDIKSRIESHYHLIEINGDSSSPAVDYNIDGYKGKIGFIAPVSKKFCDNCNRLRLTADGRLLPCLMGNTEIDVKTPMRDGASDDEIKMIIKSAMIEKPKGHDLCKESLDKINRAMSRVGG